MCQLEDKALNFPLSILHNQLCILKKNGERITQFLFALYYIFLCCIAIGFALCLRRVHVNFNDKSVMFAHTIMFYSFSIHFLLYFIKLFASFIVVEHVTCYVQYLHYYTCTWLWFIVVYLFVLHVKCTCHGRSVNQIKSNFSWVCSYIDWSELQTVSTSVVVALENFKMFLNFFFSYGLQILWKEQNTNDE